MNLNENELIKKCKNGDLDAFEILIESHKTRAYNIALKMLNNEEDAMDISQEAFIKVYRYIGNFKEDSSFSTWLYRIVVNTCLDFIKKEKERNKIYYINQLSQDKEENFDIQIEDNSYNPEIVLEQKIQSEEIKRAINELPENYKTAIILRDIQDFSYEQIAQITDCSLGAVKSRIKRGREKLKEIIIKYKKECYNEL